MTAPGREGPASRQRHGGQWRQAHSHPRAARPERTTLAVHAGTVNRWLASKSGYSLADHPSNRKMINTSPRVAVRSESRVTIASSVPEVWAYVCEVGRWPEWAPTVRECWVGGGAPLQPGSRVEQRAKGIFGSTRYRAQNVTAVEAPRSVAFAGPMGTSAARWGMELEPMDSQTEAKMWVEVDLKSVMRAIPGRVLKGRIRRVMDIEMAAIKAAVESATAGGSVSGWGWGP
jgi:polyketide cyclase/dehydrase/lipid transport protein